MHREYIKKSKAVRPIVLGMMFCIFEAFLESCGALHEDSCIIYFLQVRITSESPFSSHLCDLAFRLPPQLVALKNIPSSLRSL